MISLIHEDWGIQFDTTDKMLQSALPQSVAINKKGRCIGIALLYLLIAEKNNYPLRGVLLSGHLFVRFDNGSVKRNIEPNASGIERSDEYYRTEYNVKTNNHYAMRTLTKKEVGGVFIYSLGNSLKNCATLSYARSCYSIALSLFPGYPDALGNLAVTYASEKQYDSALSIIDTLIASDSTDYQAWQNRGAILLLADRNNDSFNAYQKAFSLFPDNYEILYGYAFSYFKMSKNNAAVNKLSSLQTVNDTAARRHILSVLLNEYIDKKTMVKYE